jgi:glycosyltransferase involved in cell wall biosynthesis
MAPLKPTDKTDQKAKLLAASALADASRRGVPSIRVMDGATWWLVPEPTAINSDSSRRSSGFPGDLPNNGQERDGGATPQAAMPQPLPGHAYFVGPWHRITPNVLRQLVLYDISRLGLRVSATWIVVPLPLRLIRASYFRLRPLLSYFRGIVLGTRRLRAAVARLVLRERPTAIESAVLIAGPAGFGEASLPHVFEAMLRNRPASFHAVPRRIVQICGSLQPGGAERQVAYTLRCLSQTNIESVQLLCHFLTHGGEHRYDFYLPMIDTAATRVREIQRRSQYPQMPDLPPALRDIMRLLPRGLAVDISDLYLEFLELKPEIVHAWLDWDNVRVGFAAVLAGVPKIILSGRNLNPTHFTLYQSYMDPAYRALAQVPNITLINNSRAGADDYADWIGIPRDRIAVVHNAVDCGKYARPSAAAARSLRTSIGVDPDSFLVGGVFRLSEEKRPLLWIDTARIVADQVPDAHFIILGSGSMQREVQQRIKQVGLGNRVILAGVVADVLPVMSIMDALLLTSHGEGLPNVLLEAQSVGTPVVATAVGGVKEAIEDGVTGWGLEAASARDLAVRLIWLHAHPQVRAHAARRAPLFVREKFGMERLTTDLTELYGLSKHRSEEPRK